MDIGDERNKDTPGSPGEKVMSLVIDLLPGDLRRQLLDILAESLSDDQKRQAAEMVAGKLPKGQQEALVKALVEAIQDDAGRRRIAEAIAEHLPPEQQEVLIEAVLAVADPEAAKRIRARLAAGGKKAALLIALGWLLDKLLEPFIQAPFETLASEAWTYLLDLLGIQRPASEARALERVHPFEPEMVLIPAGPFWMGTDRRALERAGLEWHDWMERETPYHQVSLPDYAIGKYPVTNAEYARFVAATGHRAPRHWEGDQVPRGLEDHPVVWVTWCDALAYCRWLEEVTGRPYTLPSEAEWEKAARGTDGRLWPWGNEWDPTRCNVLERSVGGTTPVRQYSPGGDSPYGVADVAGNVWEWTRSLWGRTWDRPDFRYPYEPDDGREDLEAGDDILRVLRGGSWAYNQHLARCAYRFRYFPVYSDVNFGFRCVSPV